MTKKPRVQDPLGPIEFIVTLVGALFLVFLALIAVSALLGGHPSVGTLGDPHPCLTVPQAAAQSIGTDSRSSGTYIVGLKAGVTMGVPPSFEICTNHLSVVDQTLLTTADLVGFVWVLGFLWLARVVIRRARRQGIFTLAVASGTSRLGWFLLIGSLVAALIRATLRSLAVSRLIDNYGPLDGVIGFMQWNWAVIIAAFGVISVGRVLAQTVPMREDLEATV